MCFRQPVQRENGKQQRFAGISGPFFRLMAGYDRYEVIDKNLTEQDSLLYRAVSCQRLIIQYRISIKDGQAVDQLHIVPYVAGQTYIFNGVRIGWSPEDKFKLAPQVKFMPEVAAGIRSFVSEIYAGSQ